MSGRLRVLMVGPYPVGDAPVGGVEAAVRGLLTGMGRDPRVESVDLLDFRAEVTSPRQERPAERIVVHRLNAQRRLRLVNGALMDSRQASRIAETVRPHIVHGQGIGLTGKVAVSLGLATVVTVHGMAAVEARNLSDGGIADRLRVAAVESVVSDVLRRAEGVISISEYDRKSLSGYGINGKGIVIPNAISCRATAGAGREPVLLYAGVITRRKNVRGIVDAFALVRQEVPNVRLRIAGAETDAAYAQAVRQRISDHGLEDSVEFLGSLDTCGIARELASCAGLVLFSEQETLPIIIGEAMLSGCPVVASRVGGVGEMIENDVTGLLVEAGDVDGLANGLTRLLQDANLAERLGGSAAAVARSRYDCDSVARATVDFYEHVLGRS